MEETLIQQSPRHSCRKKGELQSRQGTVNEVQRVRQMFPESGRQNAKTASNSGV